ncbi:MAG: heavy-metal-associated domain-containing protein [Gemmatimonadetes bacterium]|nr:heavy-metal-associated domain-containing protein [Gemmatimonadota bacterium]
MQQLTTAITGMSCGHCVMHVRKELEKVPGAKVDSVTIGSATVSYDEAQTTAAAILQAVRNAGYEPVA